MRKFTTIILGVLMLAVTWLSFGSYVVPPGGHVYSLQAGSTLYGINAALANKSGTIRLVKEGTDLVALGWTIPESNVGMFVCMNGKSMSCAREFMKVLQQGANVAGVKDYTSLIEYLKANGWKAVAASELPRGIRLLASIPTIAQMANSLPTLLFVPGSLLTEPELEQLKSWEG